jgi:hypothetical protein
MKLVHARRVLSALGDSATVVVAFAIAEVGAVVASIEIESEGWRAISARHPSAAVLLKAVCRMSLIQGWYVYLSTRQTRNF